MVSRARIEKLQIVVSAIKTEQNAETSARSERLTKRRSDLQPTVPKPKAARSSRNGLANRRTKLSNLALFRSVSGMRLSSVRRRSRRMTRHGSSRRRSKLLIRNRISRNEIESASASGETERRHLRRQSNSAICTAFSAAPFKS